MTASRTDAGFSTIAGLALMGVVLAFAAVVALLGSIAVTRHRAESAADLAALAAAKHALEGPTAACQSARRIAADQHGIVVSCALDGLDAVVEVAIRPPGWLGTLGLVRGRARAGAR